MRSRWHSYLTQSHGILPVQKNCGELDNRRNYLVVRLQNNGRHRALGELRCCVHPYSYNVSVNVFDLGPYSDMQKVEYYPEPFDYYVVPLGVGTCPPHKQDVVPTISFRWEKLYTPGIITIW